MITQAQARSMAEMEWGRGGTSSSRTNRKGAYYFSCSGHGGFVIDARCLTAEEREKMGKYLTPEIAHEVVRSDGTVRRFRGPQGRQTLKYSPGLETIREVEIFFAEEDCNWAIPVVLADIKTKFMNRDDALTSFTRWQGVSAHELVAILPSGKTTS